MKGPAKDNTVGEVRAPSKCRFADIIMTEMSRVLDYDC